MKYSRYGIIFVAPFFIAYLIFGLFPAIYTFALAFFQYDMNIQTTNFVGLDYFRVAIQDPFVWKGIFNALVYWFFSTIFVQVTAIVIAALLTFFKIRGTHFFKTVFYLPAIVSTAVVATIFSLFMGYPSGAVNQVLMNLGIITEPIYFLGNPVMIFCLIIFISWWMGFGSTAITASAGMSSVSDELYESAKIDGASFPRIFRKITIPLIWPVLKYMWITGLVFGLQAFDIQFMLTDVNGGPDGVAQTISMYIYKQGFVIGNVGYAAAVSTIFFLVILVITIIMFKLLRRGDKL